MSGWVPLLELVYVALPFLFAPVIFLLGWALVAKSPLVWACCVSLLLLFCWRWGGLFISFNRGEQVVDLKVVSFNLGPSVSNLSEKERYINQLEADFLVLVEFTPDIEPLLTKKLSQSYPFSARSDKNPTILLLSRFEIVSIQEIGLEDSNNSRPSLHAEVAMPSGMVHLLLIHPAPPDVLRVGRLPSGIDHLQHKKDFAQLTTYINFLNGPVILAGDFNLSAETEIYSDLTQTLIDSHVSAGRGFGFSFPVYDHYGRPMWFPLVRIDYILHSHHFLTVNSQTDCDTPSNHCLIQADLAYRP